MAEDFNISPDMIENLMNMLNNNTNNDSSSNLDSNSETMSTSSIDFDTIVKMKSIMDSLNSNNDPRSNLLYSLKPYLRKSRQSKIDQYANLLKITQISGLFKNEKGEE